jgi:hypothetical protein
MTCSPGPGEELRAVDLGIVKDKSFDGKVEREMRERNLFLFPVDLSTTCEAEGLRWMGGAALVRIVDVQSDFAA